MYHNEWLVPDTMTLGYLKLQYTPTYIFSMDSLLNEKVQEYSNISNRMHPVKSGRCAAMLKPMAYLPSSWVAIRCDLSWPILLACSADVTAISSHPSDITLHTGCPVGWLQHEGTCICIAYTGNLTMAISDSLVTTMCRFRGDNSTQYVSENGTGRDNIYNWLQNFFPSGCVISGDVSDSAVLRPTWNLGADYFNYGQEDMLQSIVVDIDEGTYVQRECSKVAWFVCMTDSTGPLGACSGWSVFLCLDLTCIAIQFVCDGIQDCAGGEDETLCPEMCTWKDQAIVTKTGCEGCTMERCACHEFHFQCLHVGGCVPYSKVCDHHRDCTDGSDESWCEHRPCTASEVACNNRRCIRSELWCDQHMDCEAGEDEAACTADQCRGYLCKSGKCISKQKVGDFIPDCPDGDDEGEYRELLLMTFLERRHRYHTMNCSDGWLPCFPGHSRCFPGDHICVYDVDKGGTLAHCGNGAHLHNCDLLRQCPLPGMYHCPNSYCIPLHSVCDGIVDCQSSEDEKSCPYSICHEGFFRCKGMKNFCINPRFICDGIAQCDLHEDDELSCHSSVCPVECSCSVSSMVCKFPQLPQADVFANTTHIIRILTLRYSNFRLDQLPHTFTSLVFLDISYNNLQEFDNPLSTILFTLVSLNLSHNYIVRLPSNSLTRLPNLQFLHLQNNSLHTIDFNSHYGFAKSLVLLNLAFNNISRLQVGAFGGFRRIQLLRLTGNNIEVIAKGFFPPYLIVQQLESDQAALQCFSSSHLIDDEDAHVTCFSLFTKVFPSSTFFSIGIFILSMSLVSALLLAAVYNQRKTFSGFLFVRVNRILVEGFLGVYLVCVAVMGSLVQGTFVYEVSGWQKRHGCLFLDVLSGLSIMVSPLFGLCHQILLQRMQLIHEPSTEVPSVRLVSAICVIWIMHVAALTISSAYSRQGLDRYCFALLSEVFTFERIHNFLAAVYSVICFVASVVLYVRKVQQVRESIMMFKRKVFTNHEKTYLWTTCIDIIVSLPPAVLLIVLAVLPLCRQVHLSLMQKEAIILFGFSHQPVYRAIKQVFISTRLLINVSKRGVK